MSNNNTRKRDVFISKHTESCLAIAEMISDNLNNRGITSWYSPRDVRSDYPEDVVEAIKECEIFLLIYNQGANHSKHCSNEISIAFDRYNRNEQITLLSFGIDNSEPCDTVQYFMTNIHKIDGTKPPEMMRIDELCERIETLLGKMPRVSRLIETGMNINAYDERSKKRIASLPDWAKVKEHSTREFSLIMNKRYPYTEFVGREDELSSIHTQIKAPLNKLIIAGMGGIGKTEIVKKYLVDYPEDFEIVIWVDYFEDLFHTIISDVLFPIEGCERSAYQCSDKEYFSKKLNIFKSLAHRNTLLIIDNLDKEDELLNDLISGDYAVIITARNRNLSDFVPVLEVKEMEDVELLIAVIWAKRDHIVREDEKKWLKKISEYFKGHTYSLKLVGMIMRTQRIHPEEMYELLLEGDKNNTNNVKRALSLMNQKINSLFESMSFTDEEKNILENLSLLPNSGIDVAEFADYLELNGFEEIDSLIERGLILYDPVNDSIHSHTLVKRYFGENWNHQGINQTMLSNILKKIKYTNGLVWKDKIKLDLLCQSVYKELPEANSYKMKFQYALAITTMDRSEYIKAADIFKNLLTKTDDPVIRMKIWNKYAMVYSLSGEWEHSMEIASQGLSELRGALDSTVEPDKVKLNYYRHGLVDRQSEAAARQGKFEESVSYALKAVELCESETFNKERAKGWALYHLSQALLARNKEKDIEASERAITEALRLFAAVEDEGAIGYCAEQQARIDLSRGRLDEALSFTNKAYEILTKRFADNHSDIGKIQWLYGDIFKETQQTDKAAECYKKAVNVFAGLNQYQLAREVMENAKEMIK